MRSTYPMPRLLGACCAPHISRVFSYSTALSGSLLQPVSNFRAARLLERMGAETRIFDPSGLPLPDDASETHPKVQELRDLVAWSEGQVRCSPERHAPCAGS